MKTWFLIMLFPVFALGFIWEWIITSFKMGKALFKISWECDQ